MAKTGYTVLLVGLGVAAAGALYAKETVKNLGNVKVKLTKIGIDGKQTAKEGFLNVIMKLQVQVTNPTGARATLQSLALSLLQNDSNSKIADITNNENLVIMPNSVSTASLTVSIPTLRLFGGLQQAIASIVNGRGFKVKAKGVANFGNAQININETINVV